MNDLQVFKNEAFGQLRGCLDEDGNPWFVAADVCAALEIANPTRALSGLDDDEKITLHSMKGNPRAGIPHSTNLINEPGLYNLVLRSRKPEAKAFKRWITHEVIPTIRKTGEYKNPQAEVVARKPTGELNARNYTVTLRQMARMKVYPPLKQALFLAEAASLMSGYPVNRYLPPLAEGREAWEAPSVIAGRYGFSHMKFGQLLKQLGLHGSQDSKHEWSQPLYNWSPNSHQEAIGYLYNPEVLRPHLDNHLAKRQRDLLF